MEIFVLLIALALIAFASWLISSSIYRRMVKNEKKGAVAVRIVTFIGSFFVIAVVIGYLILANIRIER